MTKITTDFVGNETTAVTKQRLTDILAYWGASTAAYTTWGQARTALNALLTSTTAGTIGSTELAGSFLPKVNFLNDPDDMVLDALFGAGEQGVWLDPSDVANVAWRRNLLLQTEAFDTATWSGGGRTISANAANSPVSTLTADRLDEGLSAGYHFVQQGIAPGANVNCTASVYLKYVDCQYAHVSVFSSANNGAFFAAIFDVQNGVVSASGGGSSNGTVLSATIQSVGDGWYRCSVSGLNATTPPDQFGVSTGNSNVLSNAQYGLTTFMGTSRKLLIWGAQLELGSTATAYQRITDLNTEVIERFPSATMYQDAAGTVPVYAPGQPVGLRLDKSKGLVLGSEVVVNGSFASGANWVTAAGWTISGGKASASAASAALYQISSGAAAGKTYKVTFTISDYVSGSCRIELRSGITNSASANGTFTALVRGNSTDSYIYVVPASFTGSIDDISVKELFGNHAVQSALGSRPMYGIEPKGGRRNLLTQTEDLTTVGGWSLASATSVGGATDPDAGATAFTLTATANNANILRASNLNTIGIQYVNSFYVRRVSGSGAVSIYRDTGAEVAITLTSSWVRYSTTWTATGVNGYIGIKLAVSGDVVQIWHPQQETGSTATNYQRVTTAFDVTEAGVNTCHYCQYDGSDDGMVTNSIDFSGTDKMSVFAGVRKLSDAVQGAIIESSTGLQNGSLGFWTGGPILAGANYHFNSRGNATGTAITPTSYAAPITNVLTGLGDISGDTATIRVNGVQVAQTTTDQGTGNYGNYPLYIGRRGGISLPFAGRDYGILITGKLANATAIATTEMWLANKTAGVNL